MYIFRQKKYSNEIISEAIKGAGIGGTLGTIGTLFTPKSIKFAGKSGQKYNNLSDFHKNSIVTGTGIILGAALGALVGTVKEIDKKISRLNASNRLMQNVVDNLKRIGFKSETDFTLNPKTANSLKTRICIVISKYSDELRLLINTASDPELKAISTEIIKNLPKTSVTLNEKIGDRFNEINISTISAGKQDSGFISGIAEMYIRRGYPVYLVEVG